MAAPTTPARDTGVPGAVREKTCPFHGKDAQVLDYKDVRFMRRFMSSYSKIQPRRRSGLCAKHQRQVSAELKKARYLGLMSFVQR